MQHLPIKCQRKEKGKWTNKQAKTPLCTRNQRDIDVLLLNLWNFIGNISQKTQCSAAQGFLTWLLFVIIPEVNFCICTGEEVFLLNTTGWRQKQLILLVLFPEGCAPWLWLDHLLFLCFMKSHQCQSPVLFLCWLGQLLTSAVKILLLANIFNRIARIHTGHFLLFS